ncbi:hypothetical protein [Flavobacterium sp.]
MKTTELSRKELYDLVWSTPLSKITLQYAYNNDGIKKICKQNDIPMPDASYWSKIKYNKKVKIEELNATFIGVDKIVVTIREKGNSINVNQTPLTIRTKEIESNPKAPLQVPDKMANPDILIQNTKKRHESKNDKGFNRDSIIDTISIYVQEENYSRALRIMDTFIKLLRFRGHSFSRDRNNWGPYINVNEVLFDFGIREKNKRIPGVKVYESSTYIPTGILILKIGESYKAMEWADGSNKLEKQLAKIVAKIELEAQKKLEWREECRISAIKREKEEKIRKEYEARKEIEFNKTKDLFNLAEYHHKAKIIKEYIDDLEQHSSINNKLTTELIEWIKWAKEKVDWFDPLRNKEDDLLTERDKEELFSLKKIKNSYYGF